MDKKEVFAKIIKEAEKVEIKPNNKYLYDICYLINDICNKWPNSISTTQEVFLDALIKKISINKKIWRFYDKGWKPIKAEGEIGYYYLELIIVLLLSYFPEKSFSVDKKGYSLNQLNAVFYALDLCKGNIDEEVYNQLSSIAESIFIEELKK